MSRSRKYPAELRERAVRMVAEGDCHAFGLAAARPIERPRSPIMRSTVQRPRATSMPSLVLTAIDGVRRARPGGIPGEVQLSRGPHLPFVT